MTDKIFKEIFNVTFLIAIFTGILYIAGYSYHGSYVTELTLPHDLFNVSFNEALITGYYMMFLGGFFTVIPAVIVTFLIFMCLHLTGELSELKLVRKIVTFFFVNKKKEHQLEKPPFLKKLIKLSLSVFCFFAALLFIWFSLHSINTFSSEQAVDSAKKSLNKAKKETVGVTISVNNSKFEGVILRCSASHCAILNKESNSLLIYPVSSIKNIEIAQT
ncbi:MAG: hypothetical protein MJK15_01800 [Colwellia sp.]|nr:hypothetical protein [Colwellia sp.]